MEGLGYLEKSLALLIISLDRLEATPIGMDSILQCLEGLRHDLTHRQVVLSSRVRTTPLRIRHRYMRGLASTVA